MGILSFLAPRLTSQVENVATESLGYVLAKSPPARRAFDQFVERLAGRSLELSRFETQAINEDRSRPDLIGLDAAGRRRLSVEAKFWAGLTEAQPVGYLHSMVTPGVLLFVAPAARLDSLWAELVRRVAEADLTTGRDVPGVEATVMPVGEHVLALTSWRALISYIHAELETVGDGAAIADLRQLGGLCEEMDTNAFLPLGSVEMTSDIGKRVVQFGELARDLTDRLVDRGVASVKGLRPMAGNGFSGRYMWLAGHGAYLAFHGPHWARWGRSPIWLSLSGADFKYANHIAPLLQGAGISFFEHDNRCHIPIELPTGVERDAVLARAFEQLMVITDLLPALTSEAAPAGATLDDSLGGEPAQPASEGSYFKSTEGSSTEAL